MNLIFALFAVTLVIDRADLTVAQKRKELDKTALKNDLPHIGCDVCKRAIEQIYGRTTELRRIAPYNKLEEIQIVDSIEKVCDVETPNGQWVRRLDIGEVKENGRKYLTLTEPGGTAKCGRECGTIERSCNDLFQEELEGDDLSSLIWKNKINSLQELQVRNKSTK